MGVNIYDSNNFKFKERKQEDFDGIKNNINAGENNFSNLLPYGEKQKYTNDRQNCEFLGLKNG